jgi:hypothetical protein
MTRRQRILATAAALSAATAVGAQATMLLALTGERTLVAIDAEKARVIGQTEVRGINGRLLGIDVRPADRRLYRVVADGSVVTINPGNGSTMPKPRLAQTLPAGVGRRSTSTPPRIACGSSAVTAPILRPTWTTGP